MNTNLRRRIKPEASALPAPQKPKHFDEVIVVREQMVGSSAGRVTLMALVNAVKFIHDEQGMDENEARNHLLNGRIIYTSCNKWQAKS